MKLQKWVHFAEYLHIPEYKAFLDVYLQLPPLNCGFICFLGCLVFYHGISTTFTWIINAMVVH